MAIGPLPLGIIDKTAGYTSTLFGVLLNKRIASVLSNVLGILTVISALAFLLYFIIGAINWITSAGDPKKLEQARTTILNAFIGLAITALAYPILYVLGQFFGIPILDPLELINNQLKFN